MTQAARKVSYAQNAEDIRVWRAFRAAGPVGGSLTYVDVGANEPRHLSITATLSDLGWSGLLVEADPDLAEQLRVHRPGDTVVEIAAAAGPGQLTFYRVPGTGLGTLDAAEAETARARGFEVDEVAVRTDSLDAILEKHGIGDIHFMSIDVEGAESIVLSGLGLMKFRPWVLCVEAVLPGTTTPSHDEWEGAITGKGYRYAAFDGVNRWYVADEHPELVEPIAIPFNAIDAGEHGWVTQTERDWQRRADRAGIRRAWQRELILHDLRGEVPKEEYERQIHELRSALIAVEGSRTFRYTRKAGRKAKGAVHRARASVQKLPGPVKSAIVRKRHLKHVTVNMSHLTPPALLGQVDPTPLGWIAPDGMPPIPGGGLSLREFTADDARAARAWLGAGPYDTDDLLVRRVDNHGDELGRAAAALRLRLALAEHPHERPHARGNRVLFDARSLQSAAFGNRGIGRFARSALLGLRESVGDDRITLLVDHGLEELPEDLAGACRQATRVRAGDVAAFSVLVEPSPMTASALPLVPLLHSDAHKIAIVFDFIPMHWPTLYLGNVAARAEYAAALDALGHYDEYVCISHLVERELTALIASPSTGRSAVTSTVAWPADVLPVGESISSAVGSGPIVVMTGDDIRKNTFGGLAGVAAASAGELERHVVVLGMSGQGTRVHHWSIAAAMRPGEATTAERISDAEMQALLAGASLVVVPSFDEGLSLPVIEAVRAGAPVVASDIPSHRELIGTGSYLADPRSPESLAKAIRANLRKASTHRRQTRALLAHRHEVLEQVIGASAAAHLADEALQVPASTRATKDRPLRIAVAAPWSPQRTGVADYTVATITELARLAEVTVYTTADASVAASLPAGVSIEQRRLDELHDGAGSDHDVVVAIVGNSHFHLPMLRVIDELEPVVITHDTRLVELYLSLRDRGGVEDLMLRGTARRRLSPPLDDQIDDMRLLENLALWEVARRSRMLIAHTPTAAARMAAETRRPVRLLPFANYRSPAEECITDDMRAEARRRLRFDGGEQADCVHLASFGFIDTRTKMTDVVVEAAAWLTQWGHRVSLHLVGSATPAVREELMARAAESGIAHVEITGFVDDDVFRDYVLAADLGVQLRISPLLGVSGPLSDMAAYGTPAVASRGLAIDVDAPAFIDRLPDDVSPVMVAEAIEQRLAHPMPPAEREALRREYLESKSPARYAELLLGLLSEAAVLPESGDA